MNQMIHRVKLFIQNKFLGLYQSPLNTKEALDIIVEVPCSLEELFMGCRKSVSYFKRNTTLWKTLEIPPGCEEAQKIIFYAEGEENFGVPNTDLIFVVRGIPHKEFRRDGKDLIYRTKISLLEALSGNPLHIVRKKQELLNKKTFSVCFDHVISNGTKKVIPKMGFGGKGNLIIEVEVEFPKFLPTEVKEKLLEILT